MFHTPLRPFAPISAERIAVVLAEFSSGGSERVAIRLANHWAARGRQVSIFCAREDGPARDLVAPSVNVRAIMPRLGPGESSRATIGRALASQLGGSLFDAIVGPGNYHVPLLSALAGALPAARPAIVCKISNPLVRADRSKLRQTLFLAGLRHRVAAFDSLVAMSPALQAEARAVLPRTDIGCAAEPNLDLATPRARVHVPSNMILCVGRLVDQKNFALALDAFAKLPERYRLVMLGEGPNLSQLRSQAWKLGIAGRVSFEGYVADTSPWLAQADALLATSHYEGYPAALIEALAAGVPIVTTPSTCALPEIMTDASCGRIVAADAMALATELSGLLAEGVRPSPAVVESLARRHAGESASDEWLTILDRVVERRARLGRAAFQHRIWRPSPVGAMASPLTPVLPR